MISIYVFWPAVGHTRDHGNPATSGSQVNNVSWRFIGDNISYVNALNLNIKWLIVVCAVFVETGDEVW
jgi:hypothetical protein